MTHTFLIFISLPACLHTSANTIMLLHVCMYHDILTVCEVPVAKRNFINRHEHADVDDPQIKSALQRNTVQVCRTRTPSEIPDMIQHYQSSSTDNSQARSNVSLDMTEPCSLSRQRSSRRAKLDHNVDPPPSGANTIAGLLDGGRSNSATASAPIEQKWLDLLQERAEINIRDEVKTATWLGRVLAFSTADEENAQTPKPENSPSDLPFLRSAVDARHTISRNSPSDSKEADVGVGVLLTLRGPSPHNDDLKREQQHSLRHPSPPCLTLSIETTAGGAFLSHPESSAVPDPIETIVSRSPQENAKVASELKEVLAFIYEKTIS